METKYYDTTNLFSPRAKTDRSPDFRGDVELSAELCAYIASKVKHGDAPKLSIALWTKQGRYGEYFGCRVSQSLFQEEPKKATPAPVDDSDVPF
jgi:hypothetical protein